MLLNDPLRRGPSPRRTPVPLPIYRQIPCLPACSSRAVLAMPVLYRPFEGAGSSRFRHRHCYFMFMSDNILRVMRQWSPAMVWRSQPIMLPPAPSVPPAAPARRPPSSRAQLEVQPAPRSSGAAGIADQAAAFARSARQGVYSAVENLRQYQYRHELLG